MVCKYKIFLAIFGMLAVSSVQAEERIMLSEYRADEQSLLPLQSARDIGPYHQDLYRPVDLSTEELNNLVQKSWNFGDYSIAGVMDWAYRKYTWAGDHYGDEQSVSIGSKLSFGDISETLLYYSQDQLATAPYLFRDLGESEARRTGLAQMLNFMDRKISIHLGYEYEQSDTEFLYQDRVGHSLDVGGQFPIGLGFDAQVGAAYGRYSYGSYEGVSGGVQSERTSLRAAISRSFTPSLSGGFHYSYIDEEFDSSATSRSRATWGMNLRYRY